MRTAWLGSLLARGAGVTAGAAMLMVGMLIAAPASANPECTDAVKIRINTSGKRPTSVNPDEARVRQGQKVCWKVVGKPSEIFAITYKNRSPTTHAKAIAAQSPENNKSSAAPSAAMRPERPAIRGSATRASATGPSMRFCDSLLPSACRPASASDANEAVAALTNNTPAKTLVNGSRRSTGSVPGHPASAKTSPKASSA